MDVEHSRTKQECVNYLALRFPDQVAVIRLSVVFCRNLLLDVVYAPEDGNPHHAHLLNESGSYDIPKGKIKQLIQVGNLVFKPN